MDIENIIGPNESNRVKIQRDYSETELITRIYEHLMNLDVTFTSKGKSSVRIMLDKCKSFYIAWDKENGRIMVGYNLNTFSGISDPMVIQYLFLNQKGYYSRGYFG